MNMRDEGLIEWKKDQIEIKSLKKLEDLLM
jgi:hypothetical protein